MATKRNKRTEDLARRVRRAGFFGVAELARMIGRNRVTVYKAIRNPSQFGPTARAIDAAIRRGPHEQR